jgi:hypothetical protein
MAPIFPKRTYAVCEDKKDSQQKEFLRDLIQGGLTWGNFASA